MKEEDVEVTLASLRWAVDHLEQGRPSNAANCLMLARLVILESMKEGAK